MLIEEAAKAAATPFAEVELYKGIAARATCDASDAKSRLRNATPTLLAMIGADDGSIAVLGAVLSVALGAVPSRAAALERLEAATMAREELHQRTVDALSIPTPTMSEKKAGKKGIGPCRNHFSAPTRPCSVELDTPSSRPRVDGVAIVTF